MLRAGDDRDRRHLPGLPDAGVRQPARLRDRRARLVRTALLLLLPRVQHRRLGQLGRQLRRLLRLPAPVPTPARRLLPLPLSRRRRRDRRHPARQPRRRRTRAVAARDGLGHRRPTRPSTPVPRPAYFQQQTGVAVTISGASLLPPCTQPISSNRLELQ